jgi:multidrug efflux pump subunit AcrA (membrane-fusion protein)
MNPTFSTVLAADFTGEHVSVDDVGALRARAEAAEADRARLNAANVRLMRRLAVALGSWRGNADLLVAMGRRAVAAEAALATARAEGAAAERAAIVADLRSLAAAEDLCAAEAEMSENVGRGRINGGAIVRRGAAALRAAAGVIEGRRPVEGA